MKVLVFGDSITQGMWDSRGGWVNRLREYYDKKQLEDNEHNDEPTIFNLGVSGDTTKDLLKRFRYEASARDRYGSAAFVFSIGTNNAAEGDGRIQSTPEEYVADLKELVKQAKENSGKIMFVGLPPCDESRTTPVFWREVYYRNERISALDDAAQKFCNEEDIPFVSTRHLFIGREKELFEDGLHPNDEGHKLIFELGRPELNKLLH